MKTKISKGLIFFFNNKKKLPNHFCESEVHSIILPFLLNYLNNLINHFKNNNGIKKTGRELISFSMTQSHRIISPHPFDHPHGSVLLVQFHFPR